MANLIVRNVDEKIVRALKTKAGEQGISAEAQHRLILEKALSGPRERTLAEVLMDIPPVGRDEDFLRTADTLGQRRDDDVSG